MTASLLSTSRLYRTVLSNGLTLIGLENPAADIIAARLFIGTGQILETPETHGLVSFLMALLTKGTTTLSALAIADRVESVGASLGTDAAPDYSVISLKTVSADFEEIFTLATQLLRYPSFPEAEIDLERRLALQYLRSLQEQPFTVAFNHLRQQLYGDHPYALSGQGSETSLGALTQADLMAFHRQQFGPDNLVVTIVGRIPPEQAVDLVERTLGDWPGTNQPRPQPTLPSLTPRANCRVIPQNTHQAIVMVGYTAASIQAPGFAALKLLNTYLGSGLSSRLFVELREKRGLAYDVSALYPTRLGASQFITYMGTAPENTAIALAGLRAEVERLSHSLLSEAELQAAKNKLLGQYALGKQTNAQLAQILGWYEILGLGVEFDQRFPAQVAAVTALDAQLIAQQYLREPSITLLGPEAAVTPVGEAEGADREFA
ncbi:MAG: insulinase family protein [Cyanobacteria bacterium REEB459]|nr:insulinase family protein [Cyanobacteria bacterium REEB459]